VSQGTQRLHGHSSSHHKTQLANLVWTYPSFASQRQVQVNLCAGATSVIGDLCFSFKILVESLNEIDNIMVYDVAM
jgi:hypothetical protein